MKRLIKFKDDTISVPELVELGLNQRFAESEMSRMYNSDLIRVLVSSRCKSSAETIYTVVRDFGKVYRR